MLKSKRLILEEIAPESIEQLRKWRNDPSIRRYFREYKDISKDQQKNWYAERGNNTNPDHIYFQIMERKLDESGCPISLHRELIGCCGLHNANHRLRSVEFGIFLGKSQNKGLGKEALHVMFDFAFRECGYHKITAEVYNFNNAFELYKDGLGMKEDGVIRHSQFVEGEYCDSIILSILEEEWFEKHGGRGIRDEPAPWE